MDINYKQEWEIFFEGGCDRNIFKLDCSDGYITVDFQKIIELYTWNW